MRPAWKRGLALLAIVAGAAAALTLAEDGDERRAPETSSQPPDRSTAARPPSKPKRAQPSQPPPAKRIGPMEIALQDDYVFLHRYYYDRDLAFRQARQLGVTRLKVNAFWANLGGAQAKRRQAPASLRYDWSAYDNLARAAGRHGIKVELGLIGPAPAWASADGKIGPNRPSPALFARFAQAAATHFKGRIDRYSIWNEPNHKAWIAPHGLAPAIYRRLYLAGYAAIKRANPKAQVLIGETAPFAQPDRTTAPLAFLRDLACLDNRYRPTRACTPLRADGYAHHPYEFQHPPTYRYPGPDNVTIGTLDRLARALDKAARARALLTPAGKALPIHLTEFGYFAGGKRRIPQSRRAAYLPQAFALAEKSPRVHQMLHYLLVSPPPDSPNAFFDTGIVGLDGRPQEPFQALASQALASKGP